MSDTISTIPSGVLLITGPTGSGKSSLCATAAKWCWKKHKKVTRWVTVDGGGFGDLVESLVRKGIIQVFRARTRCGSGHEGLIEETMRLATKGYWPEQINKRTGEVLPGVTMLPPIVSQHQMTCPKGHILKVVTDRKYLTPTICSQCNPKISVDMKNAMITTTQKIAEHHEQVGLYVFEGITSGGDWVLEALSDRRARKEIHGEQSNIGSFQSGSMMLDGNNRADYSFAQGEVKKWLNASVSIPGMVQRPIWTGLEATNEGKSAATMWGPKVPGQAALGEAPQWVADWIGAQVVQVEGKLQHRLYLREYRSEDGLPHRYKVRATPGSMPEYLTDDSGYFSGFSLGTYFDLVEQAGKKSDDEIDKEFPDAPGLGEEPTQIPLTHTTTPEPPTQFEEPKAAGAVQNVPPKPTAPPLPPIPRPQAQSQPQIRRPGSLPPPRVPSTAPKKG